MALVVSRWHVCESRDLHVKYDLGPESGVEWSERVDGSDCEGKAMGRKHPARARGADDLRD